MQAPCTLLVRVERRIFPLRERGVEWAGRRRVRLEVRRFRLRKAEVMVRGACKVVIHQNVMLGTRPDQPDRSLRLGQDPTSGVECYLVTVQGLEIVIGEPDPGSFEVGVRLSGQVDGQEGGKAVAVPDCSLGALG